MEIDKTTILRAWKDEAFMANLAPEVRQHIPARPTNADGTALTDEMLEQAAGGTTAACIGTNISPLCVHITIALE